MKFFFILNMFLLNFNLMAKENKSIHAWVNEPQREFELEKRAIECKSDKSEYIYRVTNLISTQKTFFYYNEDFSESKYDQNDLKAKLIQIGRKDSPRMELEFYIKMFVSFLPKEKIESLGLNKYTSIDKVSLCGEHGDTDGMSISSDSLKIKCKNAPNAFDMKLWSNSENELNGFLEVNLENSAYSHLSTSGDFDETKCKQVIIN